LSSFRIMRPSSEPPKLILPRVAGEGYWPGGMDGAKVSMEPDA
jgi:hypothetical protein